MQNCFEDMQNDCKKIENDYDEMQKTTKIHKKAYREIQNSSFSLDVFLLDVRAFYICLCPGPAVSALPHISSASSEGLVDQKVEL